MDLWGFKFLSSRERSYWGSYFKYLRKSSSYWGSYCMGFLLQVEEELEELPLCIWEPGCHWVPLPCCPAFSLELRCWVLLFCPAFKICVGCGCHLGFGAVATAWFWRGGVTLPNVCQPVLLCVAEGNTLYSKSFVLSQGICQHIFFLDLRPYLIDAPSFYLLTASEILTSFSASIHMCVHTYSATCAESGFGWGCCANGNPCLHPPGQSPFFLSTHVELVVEVDGDTLDRWR